MRSITARRADLDLARGMRWERASRARPLLSVPSRQCLCQAPPKLDQSVWPPSVRPGVWPPENWTGRESLHLCVICAGELIASRRLARQSGMTANSYPTRRLVVDPSCGSGMTVVDPSSDVRQPRSSSRRAVWCWCHHRVPVATQNTVAYRRERTRFECRPNHQSSAAQRDRS